jgi:hypothetical protein
MKREEVAVAIAKRKEEIVLVVRNREELIKKEVDERVQRVLTRENELKAKKIRVEDSKAQPPRQRR